MLIRDAAESDLPAIVAIYNTTIPSRMVTGDLEPVTVDSRRDWFHAHQPDRYPLWVAEADGIITGWLGFQAFYGRCAYRSTAELSLYVHPEFRRQGVGRFLVETAIGKSPYLGITTLVGFIFGHNLPSLKLFERLGFQQWGYLPRVAKFDDIERDLVIVGRRVDE
ncbi:MAG: GNAT family N-acetyltransferase [Cyanobacteria bacterium]|nr:GNAT family N-acetyltransferase [Cyanobacteriota bacterium]MDW8201289.1 N-acetyltransferase family protein [Cyanobacteriota bacterium SKYGB_h_bin112]